VAGGGTCDVAVWGPSPLTTARPLPSWCVQTTGQHGSYTYHDSSVGVMVQVEGPQADPQLLRDDVKEVRADLRELKLMFMKGTEKP